jgi:hypothetical protein
MLVPLYAFLHGDSLGILVLAQDCHTIGELADNMQQAAAVRVAPACNSDVYFRGQRLDPAATVAQSGLTALDRVDLVPRERA